MRGHTDNATIIVAEIVAAAETLLPQLASAAQREVAIRRTIRNGPVSSTVDFTVALCQEMGHRDIYAFTVAYWDDVIKELAEHWRPLFRARR